MKYAAVADLVQGLRDMADHLEENGVKYEGYTPSMGLSFWLTKSDYRKNEETGEYETVFNEEGTKRALAKFVRAIGPCEKQYHDDRLVLRRKFGRYLEVIGRVDRSITCKKVVKGTKLVQAQMIPARVEEEVEWKCDESISLLKLAQEMS